MNGLINELVNELNTNESLKDSITSKMVVESINNSIILGVSPAEVFESALKNLEQLSEATNNETLKEVVSKFHAMAKTPAKKLKEMSAEAGLATKIKALKESALAKDPVFLHTLVVLESGLSTQPEFRVAANFVSNLSKYNYEPAVSEAIAEVSSYLNANRSKLEILNAIHEMRSASPIIYKEACSVLEEALLENSFSADTLKMKLRGKVNMPIVNRLINTLSMVESRETGAFNLGVGNGDAQVNTVILPFFPISENEVGTVIDNSFVKLSDEDGPKQVEAEKVQEENPEFFELHEALVSLGFKHTGNTYSAKLKNMTVGFEITEGTLNFTVNGKAVEDPTESKVSEIFLMESVETRKNLATVFKNLDNFAHLEFAKRIINERLGSDAYVFTVGETIYVFEKLAQTRIIKKMESVQFHGYVMENFNYDVAELYAIQLEEEAEKGKEIEKEKAEVEKNIEKLESSIAQIDETLATENIDETYIDKLNELKYALEKNINSLKSQYITLDQSKKKA
jgi:hypothetical protein